MDTVVFIIIASIAGYFMGMGITFQLSAGLGDSDEPGRVFACLFWPITSCVATGIAIARLLQEFAARRRLPRAVARDRKA